MSTKYRVVVLAGPPLDFLDAESLFNCPNSQHGILYLGILGGPVEETTMYDDTSQYTEP